MQHARLGNTGLVVSRLSFGAMTFGESEYAGFRSQVGENEAREMVARAIDAGINVFDTADMYAGGQSEKILGKALGDRRDDVILVTKAFFRTGNAVVHAGLSRRHLIDACDASLRRLGTDFIDVYLLHNVDFLTPLEETARALDDLQRAGKVRYVGQSNYAAWQSQKLIDIQGRLGFAPVAVAQLYYSLLGRDAEAEMIPQAADAGLGVMVWGPLAGGFLTGKYTASDDADAGRRRTFAFPPIDELRGNAVVRELADIAAAHEATPAQIAIAWVLSKSQIHTVLIGASRMTQLESNLGAAEIRLSDEEIAELDRMTEPAPSYPQWIQFGEQGRARAIADGYRPE